MNKKLLMPFAAVLSIAGFMIFMSCEKDAAPVAPKKDYSFDQGFDSMQAMLKQGWVAINNSRPLGTSTWTTGEYAWNNDPKKGISAVGSYPGAATTHSGADYVICTFNAQADPANITDPKGTASCWLISPSVPMKDGDVIEFWTRTVEQPTAKADRLEMRINLTNTGTEVGNDALSVGDFKTVALTVNPTLSGDGYPGGDPADPYNSNPPTSLGWTKYSFTVSGQPTPKMGRFAFRYFVPDAGPNGANGTGVGVDEVKFISRYIP